MVGTHQGNATILQARLITLSTLNLIPIITEALEWMRTVSALEVNFIVPSVYGMNPDTIYILDTQDELSPSEQAAQQKIYKLYLENSKPHTRDIVVVVLLLL